MKLRNVAAAVIVLFGLHGLFTLHAQKIWTPYTGNPVLEGGVLDPTVVYDSTSGMYLMWFVASGGGIWRATSQDGLAWDVSDSIALSPGPAGSYDQYIYSVSVVKHAYQYFMYYTAEGVTGVVSIAGAVSDDGVHWQRIAGSPVVMPGGPGTWEALQVTGGRVVVADGKFFMVYSGYSGVFQDIGIATSIDGISWVKSQQNPVIQHGTANEVDAIYAGAAGIAVENGIYYVVYRATNSSGVSTYCLATSFDGTQWQKFGGNPVYPSPRSGWDAFSIGGGSLLWVDDALNFWYCGTNGGPWSIGLAYLTPGYGVSPTNLDFGWVEIGTSDSLSVTIGGLQADTIQVTSITSTSPVFGISAETMTLLPGESRTLRVSYTPTAAVTDTGTLTIASNDQTAPLLHVSLTGHGYETLENPAVQFSPDEFTRGLWHFNETAGSTVGDTSAFFNQGIANGTTVVSGRFGNARSFNGVSDYIEVPSSPTLNLDTSSFRIDVWSKTAVNQGGIILRRGLAPNPGFMISYSNGHLVGMIGNREDSSWPDTLIYVVSDSTYTDDQWHQVTMVRDRSARKLLLYVDGVLAAKPADDNFTIPLNSDRPLTIGRWESTVYPYFLVGMVDEVRISSSRALLLPLDMSIQPSKLDFGWTRVGMTDSLTVAIKNTGYRDTLHITSITSNNSFFGISAEAMKLPPFGSGIVKVRYTPTAAGKDTGTLFIASSIPGLPDSKVSLAGRGYVMMEKPIIKGTSVIPNTYYQVRLNWIRSLYDTAGAADPVVQYSFWRQIPGEQVLSADSRAIGEEQSSSSTSNPLWEYMQSVPAVGFEQYTVALPAYVDYRVPETVNVFMVAAHTKDARVYMSDPDTVFVDPPGITGVDDPAEDVRPHAFVLEQNFPNPFNPSTTIRYSLPERLQVTLMVYNMLGQRLATLVNGAEGAGYHEVKFDASDLPSGVYIYRIQAGSFMEAKKLLLVR